MGGVVNQVSKDVDVSEVITKLTDVLYDAMESAAEGIHS